MEVVEVRIHKSNYSGWFNNFIGYFLGFAGLGVGAIIIVASLQGEYPLWFGCTALAILASPLGLFLWLAHIADPNNSWCFK